MAEQQISKTRPNDTTTYTIGDVIAETGTSTVWTFPGMAKMPGGYVELRTVKLLISSVVATPLQANLLLFTVAPATVNDNVAAAITDAEMLKCVGSIIFVTPTNEILSAFYTTNVDELIRCAPTDTALYGVLIAVNGFVPEASQVLTITLTGTHAIG